MPPLEEYVALLEGIWERGHVTNNGPLVQRFERELNDRFDLPHPLFVGNGTIALQLALRALDITGEVITTPYSYVASTTAILWERCTPVFADIDPISFCLDPARIEALITPRTQAILATHVYGLPCDTGAIADIATRHGLKVIYDGAHAFGTHVDSRPLLAQGDISTCSFHATKIFHSVEGGAIHCTDKAVFDRLRLLRAFGHVQDEHFLPGINGKNSELHAAMGLALIPCFTDILTRRRTQWWRYHALLSGSATGLATIPENCAYNHAYFPVVLRDEGTLVQVLRMLASRDIHPRRYFYPSLTELPYIQAAGTCPVAEDIARRVLCLPLAHGLTEAIIDEIAHVVRSING